MGLWILPKDMQMVQGFPLNRSYTKAESDARYGGGEPAIETPTGAVDSSNTVYTVTHQPIYVLRDGAAIVEGVHYTYSGGTITITDGTPPYSYIRSIYG